MRIEMDKLDFGLKPDIRVGVATVATPSTVVSAKTAHAAQDVVAGLARVQVALAIRPKSDDNGYLKNPVPPNIPMPFSP